jgi:tetratricopeptide (TPR) repeat protein
MPTYDAFLSYSHARDKPIAAALQSAVQRLGKPWYRRRALRAFRDDTSLTATPQLWPSIARALDSSRYLILLASREAAASPWVAREVVYWLDHHGIDTVLIAMTDGELAWDERIGDFRWSDATPLPSVLVGRFPQEPKWVDLRRYRNGAPAGDVKFIELASDFAAAIRGIPKEDLLSQEVRQQRRALTLAWSAAALLLMLAGTAAWALTSALQAERAAIVQRQAAIEQRRAAELQRDRAEKTLRALSQVETLALSEYRKSVFLSEKLAAVNPGNIAWQRDVATSYERVGDVLGAAGRREEALIEHRKALAVRERLAQGDRGNATLQRELSISHQKIADLELTGGRAESAAMAYHRSLAIRERLAAALPGDHDLQQEISLLQQDLGDALLAAGRRDGAIAAYRRSIAVVEALAAADPANARSQAGLMIVLYKLGEAGDGGRAHLTRALAIARRLDGENRLADDQKQWIGRIEQALAQAGR